MKKRIIKIISLSILLFGFFMSNKVFAAKIYFESYNYNKENKGDFLVKVFLDTESELINAIEGTAIFPKNLTKINEINDGDSSINFWIEKPHFVGDSGEINFSGITPGGFTGQNKLIFSVILHQESAESGSINMNNLKILKNNGDGSEAEIKVFALSLPISTSLNISDIKSNAPRDIYSPEDFVPAILKDQNMFDGKNVLVFATQDKDSGIDHYEVKEGYFGKFITVQSPYLLEDQSLNKKIFIKAVDNSGNERLVEFSPSGSLVWYQLFGIIAIILLMVVLFKFKKIWSRFIK